VEEHEVPEPGRTLRPKEGIVMQVRGVYHTSFTVSDIDRSVAFYRDILGMELLEQGEASGQTVETILGMPGARLKIAFLKAGDQMLELFEYLSPKGKPYDRRSCDVGPCHVAFFVADINEAYKTLSAKGVPFKSAPQAVEMGGETHWACYMTDPDGITLELYQ